MRQCDLVQALFPADLPEVDYWEKRYPPRSLPVGAEVTRFAPSPTGSLHLGGIYVAMLAREVAHRSGGAYIVRIEDTDQNRQVPGAAEVFTQILSYFNLESDETDADGKWGPYRQSDRERVYLSHVRSLVRRELAYPCFCTPEMLSAAAEEQRNARAPLGYYGKWARCRALDPAHALARVAAGDPFVIRFRCPHSLPRRVRLPDRIRGSVTMLDNGNDVVILKSGRTGRRLPTYHFAHVVDDHLMRVTLVIRGDEWLPSLPLHRQMHEALGFAPPEYAHIAPLLKAEGGGRRRKLSKRRDPEASAGFYLAAGYPAAAIRHYLRGLVNSRLADMPADRALTEPIRLDEAKAAGAMVDVAKLRSVSRDHIAALPARDVVAAVEEWASAHDPALQAAIRNRPSVAVRAVEIAQAGGGTPRKDIACWSEFRAQYGFFFADLHQPVSSPDDARFGGADPALVAAVTADFAAAYRHEEDARAWFAQIRSLAEKHGFAPTTRDFRRAPEMYRGSVTEIAGIIRVCLVGRDRSPDLFEIARALGAHEVLRRVTAMDAAPDGGAATGPRR